MTKRKQKVHWQPMQLLGENFESMVGNGICHQYAIKPWGRRYALYIGSHVIGSFPLVTDDTTIDTTGSLLQLWKLAEKLNDAYASFYIARR